MIRTLMAVFALCATLGNAAAMSVSAQVQCTVLREDIRATLIVTGNVNPEHVGMPGLLYLALAEVQGDRILRGRVLEGGSFVDWDGSGFIPIAQIVRSGLNNISFSVDVTQYLLDPSLSLWVGYGALTPKMEEFVVKAREAVEKARALKPELVKKDVGDDWRRRSMIEGDMRKQGRYQMILPSIRCTNTIW